MSSLQAKASPIPRPKFRSQAITRNEVRIVLIILTFAIFGVFYPPESYFAPQDFTIEGATRDIGFPFARYFNVLIIIWLFIFTHGHQKLMVRALLRAWLPIMFVAWMICTAFLTADPVGSFNRGVRTMIMVVLAAYLVERFTTAQILRLLIIAGSVLMVASIFAALVLPQYGLTALIGYEGAWRGATTHKNALGGAMAALVLQTYIAVRGRAIKPRAGILIGIFALIVMIMTKSGSSVFALTITFTLYMLFQFIMRIRSKSAKLIVIFFVISLMPLLLLLQGYLDEILILVGRDPTLTGRTEIWTLVWELIQANPWTGYGNNFWATESPLRASIWLTLQWAAPHAHNMFLDIWFQTGVIGISVFTVTIVVGLYRASLILFSKQSRLELIWPIIIYTTLFRGITETAMVEPAAGAWFSLTLALTSLSKGLNLANKPYEPAGRHARFADKGTPS